MKKFSLTVALAFLLTFSFFSQVSVVTPKMHEPKKAIHLLGDYPHDPRGEITDVDIVWSTRYQGETQKIYVKFRNPTTTTYHYLVVVNIIDSNDNEVYNSDNEGENRDGYVGGSQTVSWGPWYYTIKSDDAVGIYHVLAGLRIYPWDPELDYRGLSWCEPEETFAVEPNPNFDEYIDYWELNPFDNSGDGKNDAVQLRLDVDTTDGTLVVIAYGSLYDPNDDLVDIADSSWTITGTNVEYGELYLYVPNGGLEGNYHVVVEVHDTLGNHEDDRGGWAYLYPPDYNPNFDEYIDYWELNPFDNSGDGKNDAVQLRLDVDTTDGTLVVIAYGSLYDPNDDLVDIADSSWTITGTNVEYGELYLYVPNGGLEGNYHVVVEVHDTLGNHEDDRGGWAYLYPPDYNPNFDEYIDYWELNPFDNSGDGKNDAVQLRLDVDTTDGTLVVIAYGSLYDPNDDLVDIADSSWTITGTNVEYGELYLYVPNGGLEGNYHVVVEVHDTLGNHEDDRGGWAYLYPPDYNPNFDEYIDYWELNPFDNSGDGKNDAVQLRLDVDTTDGTLVVIAYGSLYDPNDDLVDIADSSWTITGTNVEYGELYLYVPNGGLEGNYHVVVEVHDTLGNHEDDRGGWAYLYPPDYKSPEGDLTIYLRYPDENLVLVDEISALVIYWDSDYSKIEPVLSNPYTFYDLPTDDYLVKAYVNNMYSGDTGWIHVSPGSSESRTIHIPAQGYLRIQSQYNDGAPLPDANVEIESHDGTVWRSDYTDSDGWTIWFWLQPTTQSGEFYKARVYYDGYQRGESVEIMFGSYESKEISILTNVPRDNAWMHVFDTPSGILHPGDWTTTKVELENTGTTTRSFGILVSYQRPDGIWYDLDPQQTTVLAPGQRDTRFFDWQIPLDTPFGLYNARATVWHGYNSVNKVMIPPKFDQWDKTDVFTVEAIVINGEIATIEIDKKSFKPGESVPFSIEVKNTGNVNTDFWVRYTLNHLGSASWPKKTFFRSEAFSVHVGVGQSSKSDLTWIVPEEAAAGVYDLAVILYGGPENPDLNPSAPVLDGGIAYFAFILDQDVSYIQVFEIPTFIGQKRVIFTHIAKGDVAKSGVLTFKVFATMVELADMILGAPGTKADAIHMFGLGLQSMFKWAGIEERIAKQREDGSADFLDLQVIGEGALTYEDTSPLDIDLKLGVPIKVPLCPTLIREQYLRFECPCFVEIQFEWSIVAYLPVMEKYFPYWKFSKNEQWYPCSFYFDNDTNVANNKDNYGKPEFKDVETGRPPYYVYIHIVGDADYLTIQYWMYYVHNDHHLDPPLPLDHMHDWDSRVYIVFSRDNLETPIKVGFSFHSWVVSKEPISYIRDWADSDIEKENDHVIAYVAEGSHGAYHQLRGILPEPYLFAWDTWEAGGITLGVENLTNWVIVGNCEQETILPESSGEIFCNVEYSDFNSVHPVPSQAVKGDHVYWPKNFGEIDAAWHQDCIWRNTIPPWPHFLVVVAHSPVNIRVEDSMGRSVGTDENGVTKFEIPGALYTGPDVEPKMILINDASGEYNVSVYGVGDGTFDLEVTNYSGDSASVISNITDASIQQGQMKNYAFLYPLSFDIVLHKAPYRIVIFSNSTIDGFNFNDSIRQMNFEVSGVDGTIGFCNVTIPKNLTDSLWNDNYTITIDGHTLPLPSYLLIKTSNSIHTFLYFTYPHTTHEVVIIPEFSLIAVLLFFIVVTLLGLLLNKMKWKMHACRKKNLKFNRKVLDGAGVHMLGIMQ